MGHSDGRTQFEPFLTYPRLQKHPLMHFDEHDLRPSTDGS